MKQEISAAVGIARHHSHFDNMRSGYVDHPYAFRFRAHSYAFTVTKVFYADVDATVPPRGESRPFGDERSEIVQREFEVLTRSGVQ